MPPEQISVHLTWIEGFSFHMSLLMWAIQWKLHAPRASASGHFVIVLVDVNTSGITQVSLTLCERLKLPGLIEGLVMILMSRWVFQVGVVLNILIHIISLLCLCLKLLHWS